MISLVVPTRNRAHTLRQVARSFFEQVDVTEIVFVIDGSSDDTAELLRRVAADFPATRLAIVCNPARLGASQSRNLGVAQATNRYILFCDDDEYLESGYARTCLAKLLKYSAGAVSGRRVYMLEGETPQAALSRFGTGLRRAAPFNWTICELVNGARFAGDIALPFSNAVILTRKELLERFPFDAHYRHGNGYREETDYQMNLFVHGFAVYVTSDTHSIHLPPSRTRTGGQRSRKTNRIYWSIAYTNYFFRKYFKDYARLSGVRAPRWFALLYFACFIIYRETVRPLLHFTAMTLLRRRLEHRGSSLAP